MTIQAVTSANINQILQGDKVVVRNSSGIPYVIVEDTTDDGIEVWKGNSTIPTSFSEMDNTNNPQTSGYTAGSAAIDSSDIIHIAYQYFNGKTSELRYVTFDTSTDIFSGDAQVVADIGEEPSSILSLGTAIAIDFNDIPHVAYTEYQGNMGTEYWTTTYINRIGGSWGTSYEVEGQANEVHCQFPNIAIDSDNKPVICYMNTQNDIVGSAIGNANDSTSFTLHNVDTDLETSGSQARMGICVDTDGDHWICFRDESDTFIYIIQHQLGDAWTSWQTRVTNSNVGQSPSIAAEGTDIYIFYEDDNGDIVYDMYNGSTWVGETTLDTGTYEFAKVKWAYAVDNDSTGRISTTNLMDGSFDGANTTNIYGGSGSEGGAAQSFTGDGGTIDRAVFSLDKVNSPTGDLIVSVYAHSGTFGTSSLPTGAALATSGAIDASTLTGEFIDYTFRFSTPFTTVNGTKYVIAIETDGGSASDRARVQGNDAGSHAGNQSEITSGSWVAASAADFRFSILTLGPFSGRAQIDYAFKETTPTDEIQWNALVLAVAVAPVLRRTHDNYMRHLLTR